MIRLRMHLEDRPELGARIKPWERLEQATKPGAWQKRITVYAFMRSRHRLTVKRLRTPAESTIALAAAKALGYAPA